VTEIHARPHDLAIQDTARMLHDWRRQGFLPMFVVYDHPRDYPNVYVARAHLTGKGRAEPTPFAIMDGSLDTIQTTMEALGLVKLDRSPQDDPVILETWI
jgi:hypothetical protein